MYLKSAQVKLFKSIEDSTLVPIEQTVTVLVGKNESGKTAFLQALAKARDIQKIASYKLTDDYPRKNLNRVPKIHGSDPIVVTSLAYSLSDGEEAAIETDLGIKLPKDFAFSVNHNYSNGSSIDLKIDEKPFVDHLIKTGGLSKDMEQKCANAATIKDLLETLEANDKNEHETEFLAALSAKFKDENDKWKNPLAHYLWTTFLSAWRPYFFYFDDYYLLPGKVNLEDLKNRRTNNKLEEEHSTVLSLLRMAEVDLDELRTKHDYESSKAKLEGISNEISDTILKYWQNPDLSVEFDVDTDPQDSPPFNNGQNLYIRIRNSRHRVTLPFSQRSRGFIWFFSFIVWFDVIKDQLKTDDDLILLLYEPVLNLHGLAQNDLLRYLDDLSSDHQVIYTTHSPFMVNSSRLHEVRTVEDRDTVGTIISSDLQGDDKDTLFPLQAALGYTIAQNLFISKKNLLVEGPADLLYLTHFSNVLQQLNRNSLRDDVTIVPTGGLDKLATFIALLKGNDLEIAVLHDYAKKPEQRLEDLVREKIVEAKRIFNYATFRDPGKKSLLATDVEDLFEVDEYLSLFNAAYHTELGGKAASSKTLPKGERIILRIEAWLNSETLKVRPSGGFNHYRVANHFVTHLAEFKISEQTNSRFEALFETVNKLFMEE